MSPYGQLYLRMVEITGDYLGPAAGRFIDRQIKNHLERPHGRLSEADIKELITWIRASIAVLSDDRKMIEEYISRLQELAEGKE